MLPDESSGAPGRPPLSGPLHIDRIALAGGGEIGMTHCPGRCRTDRHGRAWRRDLRADIEAIRSAGFETVLTLVDDAELDAMGVAGLGVCLREAGIGWLRLPIPDFGVPAARAWAGWPEIEAMLRVRLLAGERLLVHCAAGLGRTGMIAAVLLRALGLGADDAILRVRKARPGTIETDEQAAFVARVANGLPPASSSSP